MKSLHTEILVCQCSDPAHQLVLFYDDTPDEPTVYASVHLAPERNFFKRFLRGIRYIFGRRSVFGDFDEIVLRPEDAYKLQEAVNLLNSGNTNKNMAELPIDLTPNKYVS